MGLISGAKRGTKKLLNIPRWSGYERYRGYGNSIADLGGRLFRSRRRRNDQHTIGESFEQAARRFQLSEQGIEQKASALLSLSVIFLIFSFGILAYTVLLAWHGHVLGAILGIAVTLLVLSLAFRYHFWYFQIKNRRLGCTLRDWWQSTAKAKH